MSDVDDLERRLDGLSPVHRRLYELRWRQRAGASATAVAEPEAEAEAPPPAPDLIRLSPEQEEAWAMYSASREAPHNALPSGLRFRGPLNVPVFERSLQEVVNRHHALRGSIEVVDGQPYQRFAPETVVRVPVTDLQDVPGEEREARAHAATLDVLKRPFDVLEPPVWHNHLFRLGPEDHLWGLSLPVVLLDGVARIQMVRELQTVYDAFLAGRPSPLRPPEITYPDALRHQRQWLSSPAAQAQIAYWKRELTGMRLLDLFPDRARPPAGFPRFGLRREHEIPGPVVARLARFREQEGVTLFMAFLAVLTALFSRYSRQQDVVIATAISTRPEGPGHDVLGNFTSNILLRSRWTGDPSFSEIVRKARDVSLAAQPNSYVQLSPVLRALGLEGKLSTYDANHVAMGLRMKVTQSQPMADLDVSFVGFDSGKADGTMTVYIPEKVETQVRALVEYDGELFDDATIARFTGHLDAVLERGTANPAQPLGELLVGIGPLSGS